MLLQEPSYNRDAKEQTVEDFVELLNNHSVIAVVNIQGMPAKQLNEMRANLRGEALVKMTKQTLMHRAFKKADKDGLTQLEDHFKGMPALLFTEKNPFTLFKKLKESKSPAAIKAGEEAPKKIVIPAGPTPFAPGPIIGQLGSIGVKAGIEGGKVAVQKDSVVATEGDVVNQELASILNRLEIYPMEIGLNITAVYENETILTRSVLDIDEEKYINTLKAAAVNAHKLSLSVPIPTKENAASLIQNAHRDAKSLAISEAVTNEDTIAEILGLAEAQATTLNSKTND